MNTIDSNSLLSSGSKELLSSQEDLTTAQLSKVSASIEKSTEITLMTAEGDRVTLSSRSLMEATYSTYNYLGQSDGQTVSYESEEASFFVSHEVSIKIEGDLSRQELRDIKKALKNLEKLFKDLMAGDLEHAAKRAFKIAKLDSISSLDASLQIREYLSIEQFSQTTAATSPQEIEMEDVEIEDAGVEGAGQVGTEIEGEEIEDIGTESPVVESEETEVEESEDSGETSNSQPIYMQALEGVAGGFVQQVVEVAHDSNINLFLLIQSLKTLLPHLIEQLYREEDFDPSKLKLVDLIQTKLTDSLEEEQNT